eukprot:scaffold134_cov244-Pinguiococcus_pyrenoidosus.AAC.5
MAAALALWDTPKHSYGCSCSHFTPRLSTPEHTTPASAGGSASYVALASSRNATPSRTSMPPAAIRRWPRARSSGSTNSTFIPRLREDFSSDSGVPSHPSSLRPLLSRSSEDVGEIESDARPSPWSRRASEAIHFAGEACLPGEKQRSRLEPPDGCGRFLWYVCDGSDLSSLWHSRDWHRERHKATVYYGGTLPHGDTPKAKQVDAATRRITVTCQATVP